MTTCEVDEIKKITCIQCEAEGMMTSATQMSVFVRKLGGSFDMSPRCEPHKQSTNSHWKFSHSKPLPAPEDRK